MYRYTIKELDTLTDRQFIQMVLRDRQESLTNCYSPLNQKIDKIRNKLNDPSYNLDGITNWFKDKESE
jgi:hypothetical protein